MKRLLPAPLLSAALLLGWLMLNESVSAGHLLLGTTLALLLPPLVAGAGTGRRATARPRAPGVALRLSVVLLLDILRANVTVARLVLGDERRIRPRFVRVPLTLRDSGAVALLAGMVTMTPGTLSADVDEHRRELLVHAFDVDGDEAEAALVAEIRSRYEAPLIRLFDEGDPP